LPLLLGPESLRSAEDPLSGSSSGNPKGREGMPDWQSSYLSTIFSADNKWTPDNTPRASVK
jgi:hypothetical protein